MRLFAVTSVVLRAVCLVHSLDFSYHDQSSLKEFLTNVTQQFPHITRLHSIGKSVDDADLWVIVIGENISSPVTLRPHVKYIANMHGNEAVGREILLHLVEYLVNGFGVNQTITDFLKTTYVHILPTMNPDGFRIATEGICVGATGRKNSKGFDLNRNFPDLFQHNDKAIQPETQAVMTWSHQQQFVLSANLHGGSLVADYPLNNYRGNYQKRPKYSKSPDDSVFRHLALTYSKTHPTMHYGLACPKYKPNTKFKHGITNGAAWYPFKGAMYDYNYIFAGCMEITLELSCCKYPVRSKLQSFWEANKEAMIAYLQQVHIGVKGLVTDENNNPVSAALVSVVGREEVVFKTTKRGEYWRLLLPGIYYLKVSANGYEEVILPFTVRSGEVTRLDITLKPLIVSDLLILRLRPKS